MKKIIWQEGHRLDSPTLTVEQNLDDVVITVKPATGKPASVTIPAKRLPGLIAALQKTQGRN
jgi:hypothetical protein